MTPGPKIGWWRRDYGKPMNRATMTPATGFHPQPFVYGLRSHAYVQTRFHGGDYLVDDRSHSLRQPGILPGTWRQYQMRRSPARAVVRSLMDQS